MLDHVIGDDFEQSKFQKTPYICHISIGWEDSRLFATYHNVNVRGRSERGASCRFYAADGDVILIIYGESTEYSRLGRVEDDVYDRLSSVL